MHTKIDHEYFMRLAIERAKDSESRPGAYCVGCIIVSENQNLISTGYSRELIINTHAEECALAKLAINPTKRSEGFEADFHYSNETKELLRKATLYTTLEPCSERLSGRPVCVQRVVDAGISHVVIGAREPPDFVSCTGSQILLASSIKVSFTDDVTAAECLRVAKKSH